MKTILPLIATLTAFIPLGILPVRMVNHEFKNELNAIKPFVWLMFVGALYEFIFTFILRFPSAYWFTVYTFLEFLVLWYFFKKLFQNKYNYFLLFFLMLMFGLFIVSLFYWELKLHEKIEAYLSIPISLFIFTSSFLWFKQLFDKKEPMPLLLNPAFYFISGLVIYFAGGIFVSLLIYELKILTGFAEKYWLFFISVSIIMHLMIIIGVCKGTEKKP